MNESRNKMILLYPSYLKSVNAEATKGILEAVVNLLG